MQKRENSIVMSINCPGQDKRYWKPEDIFEVPCRGCHLLVEIWKDEPKRKCPQCGTLVYNSIINKGCAQWCQYAEKCFGDSPPAKE